MSTEQPLTVDQPPFSPLNNAPPPQQIPRNPRSDLALPLWLEDGSLSTNPICHDYPPIQARPENDRSLLRPYHWCFPTFG